MNAEKINEHIEHFKDISEEKPLDDKLITVYCDDGNMEEGFVENTLFQDLGITMFIVKKWILQEDIEKLIEKVNT